MKVSGQTFPFVSRAEQLRLRGQRNFNRYMLVVKKFVAGDSLVRAQWHKEDAEESQRDAGVEATPWAGCWWRKYSSVASPFSSNTGKAA